MEFSKHLSSKTWHLASEFVINYDSYFHNEDNGDSSTVLSVPECTGRDFVLTSFTKEGSMMNQAIIQDSDSNSIISIVRQILPVIVPLTEDIYGNFTVKALIPHLNQLQRIELLTQLRGCILSLSYSKVSTFVIQTFVSSCSSEEEELYYQEFKGRVLESCKDKYGSHVIRLLLSKITRKYLYVRELTGHMFELSTNKYGISVAKYLCQDPLVLRELLGSITDLMNDCYGNYAFQNLLEIWGEEITSEVAWAIKNKVAQLSMHKFASNAIEQCILIQDLRNIIIDEIVQKRQVEILIGNLYGAFVINTAFKYADCHQQKRIRNLLPK